nr:hypothetical protein [Rhodococcus qingshengii]
MCYLFTAPAIADHVNDESVYLIAGAIVDVGECFSATRRQQDQRVCQSAIAIGSCRVYFLGDDVALLCEYGTTGVVSMKRRWWRRLLDTARLSHLRRLNISIVGSTDGILLMSARSNPLCSNLRPDDDVSSAVGVARNIEGETFS